MTNTLQLKGKVCLITGASRTLGATIAEHMATHGALVGVNYHHSEAAAQAVCQAIFNAGGKAIAIQADVTKPDDVKRLIETCEAELGSIDILVNNVGPYVDSPFLTMPLADFDRIMAGNVRATFVASQQVSSAMKQRGQGHIINIAATDIFNRSHSVYGLAKAGVVYLTEALALELAPEVLINAIAPDLIADNEDMSPEMSEAAIGGTPLDRLVTRAEVAEMVCMLCTPAFASMTGQTIVLDGGRSIPRIALG
ncbi:MAG: SDR family oxidoreductase [Chloroflexota bacterium]